MHIIKVLYSDVILYNKFVHLFVVSSLSPETKLDLILENSEVAAD